MSSTGQRLVDMAYGSQVLNSLKRLPSGYLEATDQDGPLCIEAFDQPLVASNIDKQNKTWTIQLPYGVKKTMDLDRLYLDEWDRFCGFTTDEVPFVMSRAAQAEFFRLADDYTDDSITLNGTEYHTQSWPSSPEGKDLAVGQSDYWSSRYMDPETMGWDLGQPHPALISAMPQLKLPQCRILVLGSGRAHDAAFLAEQGHFVTAVDFSPTAIEQAKKMYPESDRLRYVQGDAVKFGEQNKNRFDVVFEHTCYCAIDPTLRNQLVKSWHQSLVEGGHLLGVFFAVWKLGGPPFGSSEWELRSRLKAKFKPMYWTRIKNSPSRRAGQELLVYAQKVAALS